MVRSQPSRRNGIRHCGTDKGRNYYRNLGDRFGGNGGLSLRKVSRIITVLENQIRIPRSGPEDVWLTERLGLLPGAHMANGTTQPLFSAEMIWQDKPMG